MRLTLVDRTVDLIEEGIDLAIRIARELDPGLAARMVRDMRYVLVAAPDYLASHPTPVTPADLPLHQCIHLGYGAFGDCWLFERAGVTVSVTVTARLTINNSAAILSAVEARGSIGLIPDFTAAQALADSRIVTVLPDWTLAAPYTGAVHAVYTPGRHLALKRGCSSTICWRLPPDAASWRLTLPPGEGSRWPNE